MDEEITCAICQKSLDNVNDVVTLREKGREGINRASAGCNVLIQTVAGQKVHQTCCREYCHPSYINRAKKKERESSISSRRSFWTARLNSPLTLKLTVSSAEQMLIWRIRREGKGMCSG